MVRHIKEYMKYLVLLCTPATKEKKKKKGEKKKKKIYEHFKI